MGALTDVELLTAKTSKPAFLCPPLYPASLSKAPFGPGQRPFGLPSPDLNYGRNYIATGSAKNISELFTSKITVRKKKTYFHNFFSFTVNTEMKFTP